MRGQNKNLRSRPLLKPQSWTEMGGVFISYRRADSAGYAHAMYDRLVQNFSKDLLFMDVDAIEPGDKFASVIEERLAKCDVLIALIGQRWGGNEPDTGRRIDDPKDFVRLEISKALDAPNITVIPVLVDGMAMPSRDSLPADLKALADLHWIELSNARFSYDLERLMMKVRGTVKIPVSKVQEAVHHDPAWWPKFARVMYWFVMALILGTSLGPIFDEREFQMASTPLKYFFVRLPLALAVIVVVNAVIALNLPLLRVVPSMPVKRLLWYAIIGQSFWFAIAFVLTGYNIEAFWVFWFMPVVTIALALPVVPKQETP